MPLLDSIENFPPSWSLFGRASVAHVPEILPKLLVHYATPIWQLLPCLPTLGPHRNEQQREQGQRGPHRLRLFFSLLFFTIMTFLRSTEFPL